MSDFAAWLMTAAVSVVENLDDDTLMDHEFLGPPVSMHGLLWRIFLGWKGWAYLVFLAWMLIYCVRNDPERSVWIWVMLVFQPLGVVIYFFARWLPSSSLRPPKFLDRYLRGRELERKRIAASQIGNAHQFVEWGDALSEVGRVAEAGKAYQRALQKDPKSLAALWGAAQVQFEEEQYQAARETLERVLAIDPSYKFGDVSLMYGKTLLKLGDTAAARTHFEQHTRRWRHPESLYLLADICAQSGETAKARELLSSLIMDVDASPKSIARRFYFWKGRAKRMLRKLPAA
jgi:hypothetical protein